MRVRIWATAAGLAAVIAGASGVAFAASAPSPKPSPTSIVKTKGSPPPAGDFFDDRVIGVLAAQLGVSRATATTLAGQLRALSAKGGINTDDPAFLAIARGAGVTPQRLGAALAVAKKGLEPKQRCS